MSEHCITVDVFELHPCYIPGAHRPDCDGHERRRETADIYSAGTTTRAHLTRILADPCTGCLPRPSVPGGFVCSVHARKVADAIDRFSSLITSLWAEQGRRPGAESEIRALGYGPSWTLLESRVVADELAMRAARFATAIEHDYPIVERIPRSGVFSATGGIRPDATVSEVAETAIAWRAAVVELGDLVWKRRRSARYAVDFAHSAHVAFQQFPTVDVPHQIPALRCRNCDQLALEWHPPLFYRDDDAITCRSCGTVEPRDLYDIDVAVILAARKRSDS